MKMCQNHWDRLRQAIKSRGLYDLVAGSGQEALQQAIGQLEGERQTRKNFDPLMACHWNICSNAMEIISSIGANVFAMMCENPEHPEWECPICYLNHLSAEHDRTCTEPTCTKAKGQTFDEWIDRAADAVAEHIKTLPAE